MVTEYDVGDLVRSSTSFTNSAGAATDPTAITVKWRIEGGSITTWVSGTDVELVNDSTGEYHADVPADSAGVYYVYWAGTGTVTAADEDTWVVKPSRVV